MCSWSGRIDIMHVYGSFSKLLLFSQNTGMLGVTSSKFSVKTSKKNMTAQVYTAAL